MVQKNISEASIVSAGFTEMVSLFGLSNLKFDSSLHNSCGKCRQHLPFDCVSAGLPKPPKRTIEDLGVSQNCLCPEKSGDFFQL